jgi:hypothetical protein
MREVRDILDRAEQAANHIALPDLRYEQLLLRHDRKHRNRRVGAAVVALVLFVALAAAFAGSVANNRSVPATGGTWSRVPRVGGMLSDNQLQDITTWNGHYVAIGADGNVKLSTDGLSWADLGPRAGGGDVLFAAGPDLIASGPGSYGFGHYSASPVFVSDDALSWTEAKAEGPGGPSIVTAGGPGLIGIGQDPTVRGIAAWTSVDGLRWAHAPGVSAYRGEHELVYIDSLIAGGPGFVASGTDGPSGSASTSSAAVWTSSDGLTWSRVPLQASLGSNGFTEMTQVVRTATGLLGVGFADGRYIHGRLSATAAVWASPDGITWERVAVNGEAFGTDATIADVIQAGPGLVAVGTGGIWTSPDGATWARASDVGTCSFTAVTDGPAGLVAVGDGCAWTTAEP